jgi:hypothetical protein
MGFLRAIDQEKTGRLGLALHSFDDHDDVTEVTLPDGFVLKNYGDALFAAESLNVVYSGCAQDALTVYRDRGHLDSYNKGRELIYLAIEQFHLAGDEHYIHVLEMPFRGPTAAYRLFARFEGGQLLLEARAAGEI